MISTMKNPQRTTLLINLSNEEAAQIRAAAKRQDRTISSYVLRAVRSRINIERQLGNQLDNREQDSYERYHRQSRGPR